MLRLLYVPRESPHHGQSLVKRSWLGCLVGVVDGEEEEQSESRGLGLELKSVGVVDGRGSHTQVGYRGRVEGGVEHDERARSRGRRDRFRFGVGGAIMSRWRDGADDLKGGRRTLERSERAGEEGDEVGWALGGSDHVGIRGRNRIGHCRICMI